MTAETNFDTELLAERDAYLRELAADLEEMESLIVNLPESDGAADRKRKLARDIRSIKGVAGSYGLELISIAVHRMEDDLTIQELANGEADKFVDLLLRHKDRLTQLVNNYLGVDDQTLADTPLMFARTGVEPAATADERPISLSRVLLVDTSRGTLKVCVDVLHELGVQEIAAMQDGYEALGRLLKEPFDAVISSLHVPTIDGQSLILVLRTIPGPNQTTPVILLTASATAIDPAGTRPDFIVEKNPNMTRRLKRILGELKGTPEGDARPAGPKNIRTLKKIVLVDDSPTIHQLVRNSFKRFPEIQIASLEDPTTSVDFVRNERPDLVLLDVNMPQVSGKDVIRHLKASADLQDVPVAFLTADNSADERRELMDIGAWYVFKKPFMPTTFADELINIYNER